jgi:hypothetical protein
MPFHRRFELDIVAALTHLLTTAFDTLEPGLLNDEHISQVPATPGVYQLYLSGIRVYVGKAGQLRGRLRQHGRKISGRQNVQLGEVAFTCLSMSANIHAVSESSLIASYQSPWNANGFGNHDPGRNREETNKPPDGFDALFPVRTDWPCDDIAEGTWNCWNLLRTMKKSLPFLLRYQGGRKGHADYTSSEVHVPHTGMPVERLLRLIAENLPGWQATKFPSHFILYKEQHTYEHGTVVWPV